MSLFERIDRKISNMSTMLTRFGIDPTVFAQKRLGTLFTTSMRACQACPNGEMCQGWLKNADSRIDRIPEFCPNALRFERAKAMMRDGNALN